MARLSEADLFSAIAAAHAEPEWACFRDVGNATGQSVRRRADAIAINLYPSRGLEVRGFEVKVSLGDLKKELATPDKAELIAGYCNTWWLVVPAGLTDKVEVPLAWGIMEFGEKGLRTKRAAVPRPDDAVKPLTKSFVAALARAAHKEIIQIRTDHVPRADIQKRMDEQYQRGLSAAPHSAQYHIRDLEDKIKGARPILAELGIDIDADRWGERLYEARGKELAAALRLGLALLDRGGVDLAVAQISAAQAKLESVNAALRLLRASDLEVVDGS